MKKFDLMVMLLSLLAVMHIYPAAEPHEEFSARWIEKVTLENIMTHLKFTEKDREDMYNPFNPNWPVHVRLDAQKKTFVQQFGLILVSNQHSGTPWLAVDPSPDKSGYAKVKAALEKMEAQEKVQK